MLQDSPKSSIVTLEKREKGKPFRLSKLEFPEFTKPNYLRKLFDIYILINYQCRRYHLSINFLCDFKQGVKYRQYIIIHAKTKHKINQMKKFQQEPTSRIAMTVWSLIGLYAITTTWAPISIEEILFPVIASNSTNTADKCLSTSTS